MTFNVMSDIGSLVIGKKWIVSASSLVMFSEFLPLLTSKEAVPADSRGLLLAGLCEREVDVARDCGCEALEAPD